MTPGHTMRMLIDLCARLRLACESRGCNPADVRLDDLAPDQRERLELAARDDLWLLICEGEAPASPTEADAVCAPPDPAVSMPAR